MSALGEGWQNYAGLVSVILFQLMFIVAVRMHIRGNSDD